ncbi:hypothetical protein ABT381_15515 [Streptomyces sp. NPDC000151]|uniref:hypothetical protein n=1 Tax=Streptomyces sp. NPDC000151 TaxID=3154244 RepID=UPI00331A87D1
MKVDPRLAQAYHYSEGKQARITQFLAGAPAQMERYRNAPEEAREIIDAAIDLRRFGHTPTIPEPLLAQLASAALDPEVLNALDENWFHESLEYTLAPCKGVGGPLSRVRSRPGESKRAASYRLSDYIEQAGRAKRGTIFPSVEFCPILLRNIRKAEQLRAIASSLEDAGRTFYAAQLYLRGMELGDYHSGHQLAEILEYVGDTCGALEVAQIQFSHGDPDGAEHLAHYLYAEGKTAAAEELCIGEFDKGNYRPLAKLRESYDFDGNAEAYRTLEGKVLSPRLPGLYFIAFESGGAGSPYDKSVREAVKRLQVSEDEAARIVNEELQNMKPRLDLIVRSLKERTEEMAAATVRLQNLIDEGPHGERKAIHEEIMELHAKGDLEGARKEIVKGLNAGLIGLEAMEKHLVLCGQSNPEEPVMRLGVDWDANPMGAWNLAEVRRACRTAVDPCDSLDQ